MMWQQLQQHTVELGWSFYGPVLLFVVLCMLGIPVWAAIGAASSSAKISITAAILAEGVMAASGPRFRDDVGKPIGSAPHLSRWTAPPASGRKCQPQPQLGIEFGRQNVIGSRRIHQQRSGHGHRRLVEGTGAGDLRARVRRERHRCRDAGAADRRGLEGDRRHLRRPSPHSSRDHPRTRRSR